MKVNETINLYGMDYISRGHVKVADTALKLQGKIVECIGGGSFGDIFKVQIVKSLLDDHKDGDFLILKKYKNSVNTIKNKKFKFNVIENIDATSSSYNVHYILKYFNIPTYINYEVLFDDPVNIGMSYLLMDDLTNKTSIVFSLNNQDESQNQARQIFNGLPLKEKNTIIESVSKQIDYIIKLSTGADIKLHYDSIFFIFMNKEVRVMVGDLDNIEAYVSWDREDELYPSAHLYYGNLSNEIIDRNKWLNVQLIKDFSDFAFGITDDIKEKLGAFFSS